MPLVAEINPRYYREMQKKAPEQLRLRVDSVESDPCNNCETFKTRVSATVTKVVRSKSGMKRNQSVWIEYEVYQPRAGWAGPRPMPALRENEDCDFFGRKTGTDSKKRIILDPGARGYSFQSLLGKS